MAASRIQFLALAALVLPGSTAFLKVRNATENVGGTAALRRAWNAATAVGNASAVANAERAEGKASAVALAIAGESEEDAVRENKAVQVEDAGAVAEESDTDVAEEAEDPADAADADAAEAALYGGFDAAGAGVDAADAEDASPDTDEASLLQADDVSGDDTDETYLPESDFLKAVKMSRGLFAGDSAFPRNASLAKSSSTTSVADLIANPSKAAAADGQQIDVEDADAFAEDLDTGAEEEAEDPADAADADAADADLYGDHAADAEDASGDTDEASLLQASLAKPNSTTAVADLIKATAAAEDADALAEDFGTDAEDPADAADADAAEAALYGGVDAADAEDASPDTDEASLLQADDVSVDDTDEDVADADEESTEDTSVEEDVDDADGETVEEDTLDTAENEVVDPEDETQ